MAAVVDFTAHIPEHRLRVFREFANRFQEEVGMSQRNAVRRCTVALIKSLRARTAKARPTVKKSVFKKYDGPGPHYITPHSGAYWGQALHRWTKAGYRRHQPHTFVYAAESKQDAWQRHGKITRHGLAKKSWGWFMKALFNRSEGADGGGRLKIDGRMVEGGLKEIVTGSNPRVEVLILNRLDYITAALTEADLSAAVSAANDSLLWQLNDAIDKARKKEVE